MTRYPLFVAVPLMAALALVGCGDPGAAVSDPGSVGQSPTEEAPVTIGAAYPRAAALGESVVYWNPASIDDPSASWAYAYAPDAGWTPLAGPRDDFTSVALASTDGKLVVAGAACVQDCERSRLQFFMTDSKESDWRSIGPTVELDVGEPELQTLPGFGSAVFSTPAGLYRVTPAGEVVAMPDPPLVGAGTTTFCVTDDYAFAQLAAITNLVDGAISGPPETVLSEPQVLEYRNLDAGWIEAQRAPDDLGDPTAGVCAPPGVVFVSGGMETIFDFETRRWTEPRSTGLDVSTEASGSGAAIASDGSLFVAVSDGEGVAVRSPSGRWSLAEGRADSLLASEAGVFGVEVGSTSVERIEAER